MDPLVFEPFLRPQIWGGRRLEHLNKALPSEGHYGECWEISAHPLHISRVAEGPQRGCPLTDLDLKKLTGSDRWTSFPLLLKLLDCRAALSVQVHPNDEMARELLGTENGKSEAWIILEAEPGSRIYAGFKPHVTRADVEQALQQGTVVDCLHALSPRPGDCLFIPAGQVHAIEGGVLLAEVQQTSDATFRLFDWNRVGLEGKPRELHHAESLRCINWPAGPVFPAERVTLSDLPHSVRGDRLVSSPYFEIERFSLNGPWDFQCHSEFSMWMMTGGTATLKSLNGPYSRRFQAGETVLIPASPEAFQWSPAPTATVLGIRAVADCAEEHGSIAFQSHRSQGDARTRSAFSIPRVAAARRAA